MKYKKLVIFVTLAFLAVAVVVAGDAAGFAGSGFFMD